MSAREFSLLENAVGYRFGSVELLRTALVHRSKSAGSGLDNERLEFLGDAVVGLVVADLLGRAWPEADEGRLSRRRAALVNAQSLAEQAQRIGLGEFLVLGRGEEKTGGRTKSSILSGGYEALLGAVYLDGGFGAAFSVIEAAFSDAVAASLDEGRAESKTKLQELTQQVFSEMPVYELLRSDGPDHAREYEVHVRVEGRVVGVGQGSSKKLAEQNAAAQALLHLAAESRNGDGG